MFQKSALKKKLKHLYVWPVLFSRKGKLTERRILMEDAIIVAAVFSGIALVFKIIADAITRNKLINKGMVDENIKYLFTKNVDLQPVSNIKWGLVLVGLGLAILIKQFAPFYLRDESVLGLMFLFAGIAFLIYYWVAKGKINEMKQQDQIRQ